MAHLTLDTFAQIEFWRERLAEPCFVYVIREKGDEAIKVGVAKDPAERLKTLQTGNRRELVLLHVIPGGHDTESHFHRRLWDYRVRGEWFEGKAVAPFLTYFVGLAERMMDEYVAGSGQPPHVFEVDPLRFGKVRKPPTSNPVAVRFVEPSPKMDPAEAQWRRGLAPKPASLTSTAL